MNFHQHAQNLCRLTMPSGIKKAVPAFLLLFSSQVYATANAQRISLHLKNRTFKEAIESIKKQSGYELVLVQKHLGDTHAVSIDLDNKGLRESLDALTKDQPVGYEIKGNTIVLRRKQEQQPKAVNLPRLKEQVKGRITDESGAPLADVTIKVNGSTIVTKTDNNGEFNIDVPESSTLLISSVGYETINIRATDKSLLNLVLKKENNALSEVVVVGYGTQKRKNLTGSVSTVKMSEVNNANSTNFAQGLAGRAAGVNVVQTTGQPGAGVSVQIRSNASFASTGPLYVVDGVIINDAAEDPTPSTRYGAGGINRSPLNFINPNDIENIDILKDASATAIYGARAAGGVVLITTKKGKQGLPTIQYDFSHAIQKSLKYYDILGTKDYMNERNRILKENWMLQNKIGPYYGNVDPGTVKPFVPKYTQQEIDNQQVQPNAIDAIMRTGKTQQHNLSMSGVSNKTNYYISGNYVDQEGVLRNSDYKRFSGRFNLDQGIGENIKVGVNMIATGSKANNGSIGDGMYENSGIIGAAFYYPATMPFQDEKGNYPINPDYQNTPNPLSFLTITDLSKNTRYLTSGYAEWKVIDGLTARGSLSYDKSSANRSFYFPRTFLYGARAEGMAGIYKTEASSTLAEYTLNYVKNLSAKSKINALLGHSYQVSVNEGSSINNDHFPTDEFLYYNIGLGTGQRPDVQSNKAPDLVWKSYFARVVYEYDGKYILSGTVRKDGSSKFARNKKWGTFPGVSAAWIASEEEFIKSIPAISFLKVRAGYGSVGNADIGGSAFARYENVSPYVIGGINLPGVKLTQIENSILSWETQTELNAGLDFGLFNGRLTGNFDYFNRSFTNLLSEVDLLSWSMVPKASINAGKTRSRGWEISLQSKNIVNQDGFNWNSTVNFSHYTNTWVTRSPQTLRSLARYIDPKGNFNAQYGYLSDGIYNPDKMEAPSWMPGIIPGEVVIKDVNGYDENGNLTGKPDGQLSTADMVQLNTNSDPTGNNKPNPNYSFGMNNQFSYKNFDLSVYVYGLIQKKTNRDFSNNSDVFAKLGAYGWNVLSKAQERWAYDNPNGTMPTGLNGVYGSYASSSDFWIENGNFVRVRDITLGYRLPQSLLQKQKAVKNMRVYLNVQNPFIITSYKGIDPELNNLYAYPMTRSFTIGASVGF